MTDIEKLVEDGAREFDADIAALFHLSPPGFQVCNSGASYQKYNSTTDTVQFWAPPPVTTDPPAAVRAGGDDA